MTRKSDASTQLQERIEAAIEAWRVEVNHVDTSDCVAYNEGQFCCLDRPHKNYAKLIAFLVEYLQ